MVPSVKGLCIVFGVWCLAFGVWRLAFRAGRLVSRLVYIPAKKGLRLEVEKGS